MAVAMTAVGWVMVLLIATVQVVSSTFRMLMVCVPAPKTAGVVTGEEVEVVHAPPFMEYSNPAALKLETSKVIVPSDAPLQLALEAAVICASKTLLGSTITVVSTKRSQTSGIW